jgi:drug/metabolite transporter (DMT)-like permease
MNGKHQEEVAELRVDRQARIRHYLAAAALALAGCLWGTGFLFGKIAMEQMTVAENVAFRFASGALVLLPIAVRSWKPYRGRELVLLIAASIIGVPLQFLVQFRGLQLTTVSHASLIVGVLPVLLAVTSATFLHERLHAVEWAALVLSALGAMLISISSLHHTQGPRPTLHGDLLVLISMFAAAVMVLCSKRLIASHGALAVTTTTILLGTVLLFAWVELTSPVRFHFSGKSWAAAAAQGLLATAGAYLFWNWGLAHMPASKAGVFLNLEPVVGTILGVFVLGERLGLTAILGGVLIIGAAVYFSLRPQAA